MSQTRFSPKDAGEPLADDVGVNTCVDATVPAKTAREPAVVAVVAEDDSSTDGRVAAAEKLATTQWSYRSRGGVLDALNRLVPHGGAISGIYNMASVTLGSGIFSLPFAFRSTGILTAVLVLVAITLSTVYSIYLLIEAVDKTGRRLRGYEALARGLLGRGWDYLAAFNMWMFCFGSCVSYVISMGDLLSRVTDDPSVNSFLRTRWGNRVLVIIVWVCAMLPLTIPKQVNSLRYVSVIGVTFMMYFVVVIVIHSAMNGFENGHMKNEVKVVRGGNDALIGFSMYLFAYLAQTNTLEVAAEMQNLTSKRITVHASVSMAICTALYIVAGFFGYADFGDSLGGSVLRYYNVRTDAMVAVGYVGLGFKLCVSFAICMQPSRDSVYYCLGWHVRTLPFWINALVCAGMSVVALVLGLFIPKVEIVFGLVGSFCGGFIGFIFPALFIMYAGNWGRRQVGWFHYLSTYLLLIAGVIAVVFGTVAAVYGVILDA
ncbi:amino acid transporter [Novymonas esmeraldas]|uniref:Amino acid transporter n=1 Tax=Novymonas esmeraldas TaxID=1808958 RepID=A0AAW0EP33_9TRYP